MKKLVLAAALAVALSAPATAQQMAAGAEGIPWPAALKHTAGKAPAHCMAFVQPNGWAGSWQYGNIPVGLFIESVSSGGNGTCQAVVGYGWGKWRGGDAGYTPGIVATISRDGTLTVPITAISATATFTLRGGTLEASWVRGNTRNHGKLVAR